MRNNNENDGVTLYQLYCSCSSGGSDVPVGDCCHLHQGICGCTAGHSGCTTLLYDVTGTVGLEGSDTS